jgi:hypothetical protein
VAKRGKLEEDEEATTRKALKKQSEVLWNTRQQLREELDGEEMEELLRANGNYKSKKGGVEKMLDKLVDMVVYGTPEACPECNGPLNYRFLLCQKQIVLFPSLALTFMPTNALETFRNTLVAFTRPETQNAHNLKFQRD